MRNSPLPALPTSRSRTPGLNRRCRLSGLNFTAGMIAVGLAWSSTAAELVTVQETITLPGGKASTDSFLKSMHSSAETPASSVVSVVMSGSGAVTLSRPTSTWSGKGLVGYEAYGTMDKKHHSRTAGGAPGPSLEI